jgi:hypothetical protein
MEHQIITPIHYYIDNDNNKIFDIEEIERLFHDKLNELKTHNANVLQSYKMEAL